MLCQFSFQNFKSYRGETVFDLQAAGLPEFQESLITAEKASPLLPVSVIYGPNGGGKTNLLQALSCLISIVTYPIFSLKTNRTSHVLQQRVDSAPFLLDNTSRNEPTEFLVYFRTKANEFQYFISLLNGEVIGESLSRRAIGGKRTAHIFDRENGSITLGASINKKSINTDVNPKMPYLSFLAINYSIPVITEAQEWFESCIIRNYANPHIDQEVIFSSNNAAKERIVRFLNDMGIDISDYRYDQEADELYIAREINGAAFELPFHEESDGTKKLIAALPVVLLALSEGRLLIVDELDAKLHPKLLRYIISLFQNPEINKHGAQLVFTSHDMSTLKNTVFRRDEIWFAAMDQDHTSEIYSLHEIRREGNERVNNTAAYDKQYLEGRYGADPYLQNMLSGGIWG